MVKCRRLLRFVRPQPPPHTHTGHTVGKNHIKSPSNRICERREQRFLSNTFKLFAILFNTLQYFSILYDTYRTFRYFSILFKTFKFDSYLELEIFWSFEKFWNVSQSIAKYHKVLRSIKKYRKVSQNIWHRKTLLASFTKLIDTLLKIFAYCARLFFARATERAVFAYAIFPLLLLRSAPPALQWLKLWGWQ